ncbi:MULTISPECIES: hypothetical protein [unclassified Sphingopyxis]|uniref:hypothetical protein n=1 Tax=unclassified Sphingopyxis TaxID=2614943 RepID=UPI0006C6422D|nr:MULTISPECIES: hypothetical protein [unclassified Sphingopyxis]USI75662.1 hypothetical protein KEC45_12855 [Sphingopyxis sp. USTB-05]GAO77822.1 hypothetical protein SC1_01117 [Sphingopyxis sp. C-1]
MSKGLMASAMLALAVLPGVALAQEGEKFDCVVTSIPAGTKSSIGSAMAGGGDAASREALFKQLGAVTDDCVTRHGITDEQKPTYFDYSLARISREWLIGDIAALGLSNVTVDKALDFGPNGANPDLSGDMTEEQIMKIVQAYIDAGVDIEKIDGAVWEKVGAYAAATSIYWNKRKQLAF